MSSPASHKGSQSLQMAQKCLLCQRDMCIKQADGEGFVGAAPVLDVDWSSHNTFATCSTDQMIYVCRVGEQQPVHRFEGHSDEVNAVKWDSTGGFAAPIRP